MKEFLFTLLTFLIAGLNLGIGIEGVEQKKYLKAGLHIALAFHLLLRTFLSSIL